MIKMKTTMSLCKPWLQATLSWVIVVEGKDMELPPLGMSGNHILAKCLGRKAAAFQSKNLLAKWKIRKTKF